MGWLQRSTFSPNVKDQWLSTGNVMVSILFCTSMTVLDLAMIRSTVRKLQFVRNSLTYAGFFIDEEKSNFQPQHSMKWTKLVLDSKNISLSSSYKRILDTLNSLKFLWNVFPLFAARELARFSGQIHVMCVIWWQGISI